jgi:hypothetical protein
MPLIEPSTIRNDPELYPRLNMDQDHVERIAEAIRIGAKLPPIVVTKGDKRFLIDGYHRLAAHRKVHGDGVAIQAVQKALDTPAARLLEAIKLNAAHGRPLSQEDRVRCVAVATKLDISESAMATALNVTAVTANELKSFVQRQQRKEAYDQQTADFSPREPRRPEADGDADYEPFRIDYGPRTQGIGKLESPSETAVYVNRLIIAFANGTIPRDPTTCRQLRNLAEYILKHLQQHEVAV